MTALLLAIVLSWNAVTLDCAGALERGPVTYRVDVFESRCTGRLAPCDADGALCPECFASIARETTLTSLTIEEPAVGEVIGWDGYPDAPPPVRAEDGAGNVGPSQAESCP